MRSDIVVIAVVIALARVTFGENSHHPYAYDDYSYWNQDKSGAAATRGVSYNPSARTQFRQLVGEGVPAAFLFSAAGVRMFLKITMPKCKVHIFSSLYAHGMILQLSSVDRHAHINLRIYSHR